MLLPVLLYSYCSPAGSAAPIRTTRFSTVCRCQQIPSLGQKNGGQHRTLYDTIGALEFGREAFPDYRYAQVGGTVSWGSMSGDLSYSWNNADGDTRFGREAIRSPELLLQMAFRLR